MKTKTFLLIVLFSIGISTSSFAQNQGATLNQTVEWIKSYLGANGERLHFKGGDGYNYLETITFDFSTKILLIEQKHTKANDLYVSISIDLSKCTSIKKGYLASSSSDFVKFRVTNDEGYKSKNDSDYSAILFGLTENGDYTKLDKAFKHLFELCGIKLMNEDLF